MPKVKYSGLITALWGKLGGSVFMRNKSGYVMKQKTTPINPQSNTQMQRRQVVSLHSRTWAELTGTQRTEWNSLALLLGRTDYFGDSYYMSGFNVYNLCNINLKLINRPLLSDAPTPRAIVALVGVSVNTIYQSGNSILLDFTGQTTDTNVYHAVYCSPCISAGINYNKKNFAYIQSIPPVTTDSFELYPDYIAKHPYLRSGLKLFFKLIAIDKDTGLTAISSTFYTIIQASITGIGYDIIGTASIH